ncbi:MAG: hypothetical protein QM765_49595 [Myxococcales bacterium]
MGETRVPGAPGLQAAERLQVAVAAALGLGPQLVEQLDGAQVLAVGAAQALEAEERVGVGRNPAQRRVEVQARGGAVLGEAPQDLAQADVGAGGLGRVAGQRGDAAVRPERALGLARAVARDRQGLKAVQVVGSDGERVLEGAAGQAGSRGEQRAAGGGEGVEGARLLVAGTREGAQLEEELAGGLVLTPRQPEVGLDHSGTAVPGRAWRSAMARIERQVLRVPAGGEQPQQALAGEWVRIGPLAAAQVVGLGGGEVAAREQLLALGEGPRALDAREQLGVQGHLGAGTALEVEVERARAGIDPAQAGAGEIGDAEAAQRHRVAHELLDRIEGDADGAEGLGLGDRRRLQRAPREQRRRERRRDGRRAVQAHVVDAGQNPAALGLEADPEGEGGGPLRRVEQAFALEQPRGQVQAQAGHVLGAGLLDAGGGAGEQLVAYLEVQVAEAALLALVARGGAAGDVEREADVRDDQRQVGDGQTFAERRRAEPHVHLPVVQAQLRQRELARTRCRACRLGRGRRCCFGIGVCGHAPLQRESGGWRGDAPRAARSPSTVEILALVLGGIQFSAALPPAQRPERHLRRQEAVEDAVLVVERAVCVEVGVGLRRHHVLARQVGIFLRAVSSTFARCASTIWSSRRSTSRAFSSWAIGSSQSLAFESLALLPGCAWGRMVAGPSGQPAPSTPVAIDRQRANSSSIFDWLAIGAPAAEGRYSPANRPPTHRPPMDRAAAPVLPPSHWCAGPIPPRRGRAAMPCLGGDAAQESHRHAGGAVRRRARASGGAAARARGRDAARRRQEPHRARPGGRGREDPDGVGAQARRGATGWRSGWARGRRRAWRHCWTGWTTPPTARILVEAAEDSEAALDVINFLKSLPRERYDSLEMVQRDLGEAARRFGMGGHAPLVGSVDRRNLGRDAVEENIDGNSRHP